jgi:hypothetical protein
MGYTVFSAAGLSQVVRAGDSRRFNVDLKNDRNAIIDAVSLSALAGSVRLNQFHTTKLRGKPCVSYSDYEHALVLRSVARHLRKRLKVTLHDRNRVVRGVITSLIDSTPMSLIRCDIESFYETIPIVELRDKLLYDTASSSLVRLYFKEFFDSHCAGRICGLPRGAGLSAILAELAIRPFDEHVRALPNVFRYFRYADDIIVFVTGDPGSTLARMRQALPPGMRFNRSKTHPYDLTAGPPPKDAPKPVAKCIDYLGYRLAVEDVSGRSKSRTVEVTISPKKLSRLKSKMVMAFRSYAGDQNHQLLHDRLRFISSNYRVKRSGNTFTKGSDHIKSGIYYNYALCGRYRITEKSELTRSDPNLRELKAMDGMMRGLIRSKNSEFRPVITTYMPASTRLALLGLSFAQGFESRMLVRVTPERVSLLKRAWRNV